MNREGENRKGPSFTSLVACGIIVLAGYVLAPGPAIALAIEVDANIPEELGIFLCIVYMPLEWCGSNVECVGDFYDWYMPIWR